MKFSDFFKKNPNRITSVERDKIQEQEDKKFYQEYSKYFIENCDNYKKPANITIHLYFVPTDFNSIADEGFKEVYGPKCFDLKILILYKTPLDKWLEIWDDRIFKNGKLIGAFDFKVALKKQIQSNLLNECKLNHLENY